MTKDLAYLLDTNKTPNATCPWRTMPMVLSGSLRCVWTPSQEALNYTGTQ